LWTTIARRHHLPAGGVGVATGKQGESTRKHHGRHAMSVGLCVVSGADPVPETSPDGSLYMKIYRGLLA
jgi:hypothetical protein